MTPHKRSAFTTEDAASEDPEAMEITSRQGAIAKYLRERVPEFEQLTELRQKGWNNPQGDAFFEKQRQDADKQDSRMAQIFFDLMQRIGQEMQQNARAFRIRRKDTEVDAGPVQILDFCMAPGGFLGTALKHNPDARAVAFTLPPGKMGHEVRLSAQLLTRVELKYLDVTMLAEDMGVDDIPEDHPEVGAFLPRQIQADEMFDLVLCDGQVLRKHERLEYRQAREACRLICTQLALGLEHLRPGGSMVVLLHKVERWETVCLLRLFSQFAQVRLYKPRAGHVKRSSFYMLATNVRSDSAEAHAAVRRWKSVWYAATFGSRDEFEGVREELDVSAEDVLDSFGERLVSLGRHVWRIQAEALARASFVK